MFVCMCACVCVCVHACVCVCFYRFICISSELCGVFNGNGEEIGIMPDILLEPLANTMLSPAM